MQHSRPRFGLDAILGDAARTDYAESGGLAGWSEDRSPDE